ncbi:MAG: hypothetical protein Q8J69_08950 [Sphingobacteriaceae bacterium]|nr:hypothetical protein [Sphingobacteriaceae bacterium]
MDRRLRKTVRAGWLALPVYLQTNGNAERAGRLYRADVLLVNSKIEKPFQLGAKLDG